MGILNRLFGQRGRRRALNKFAVMGVVLAFLLLFLGQSQVAHAATITVNTTADELNADGDCSLREAIQAANTDTAIDACTAGSGADTIDVPAGTYTLSIVGVGEDANASGDLDITADLTINGDGAATTVIDGAGLDRVLHVAGHGVTVQIFGLTIRNGSSGDGGGILSSGPGVALTLSNSTVTGNSATGGAFHNGGGAIYSIGTFSENARLTLNNSTVSGNYAGYGGGGILIWHARLTLNSSTVSSNTAVAEAGGIRNLGGTVILNSSTVSANTSTLRSGGIESSGVLTLNDSTVSGNRAQVGGGITNGNMATLNNSTVSGNTAPGCCFGGGGILNFGTLTLNSSTVSGNSASPAFGGGGILNPGSWTLNLKNTIIANNSPDDCSGSITSAGHNLIENTTGCAVSGDTTGNITGVDPNLAPLADNGGPTQTHALLAGSPAIDAGSPDCPPPATDQRGVARPQGVACDIGAFELVAVISVEIDIKPGSDPNCFNNDGHGVIPVAILSSDDFDATQVDPITVMLDSRAVKVKGNGNPQASEEDVNGDSFLDLVVQIEDTDGAYEEGDTIATLTGETFGGIPVEGTDSICIVP